MRSFRIFSLITTICIYLVIFAGGLVRVSGAGLGCPDWPKCFGRWLPPTSIDQIPADIDPAQFNITLAWIEYVNRLVGAIVGFLVAGLAVWAILKFRKHKRIVLAAVAAAILVAFQGWHGSVVVASGLHQATVSVHYFLALVIAGLMIFLYVQTHNSEQHHDFITQIPKDIRFWGIGLFVLAFLQIFLGTQIRSVVEDLAVNFPLLSGAERLAQVGTTNHLHLALGLTLAAAVWIFGLRLRKNLDTIPPLVKFGSAVAAILVLIQILLGMVFIIWGLVPVVQLFHLYLASAILGMLILILSSTFYPKEK
jgi:cytochrome c oxidase assembly protein subunit 15